MEKIYTWIAYGAVIVVLVLLLGGYAMNYNSGQRDLAYPYGQTDHDRADAMQVAFNDSLIKSAVLQAGRYNADITMGGSFGDSGYRGVDGRLALVNISTAGVFSKTFQVQADVTSGREMEARYPISVLNKHDFVLLPKGATWYHAFQAGAKPASIDMEFNPLNAALYPVIVDRENFDKYMSGQPFVPLAYSESQTGQEKSYGGSLPVTSLWHTNVTIQGAEKPQTCYLILPNNGKYGDMFVRLDFKDGE